jgi:tRNA U34 5-methylaminomethyl-2-thiouridine-forming methyltransferase MnmC
VKAFYQQGRERFNRDRHGDLVPDVTTGSLHAIAVTRHPISEPFIAEKFSEWHALCGRRVKVILLSVWDEDITDSCTRCAELMRTVEYGDAEFHPNWTGLPTRPKK